MNTLTYRGYSATVGFDPDDTILVGRVAGIRDVVGFHAETAAGIVEAFHDAVDDYIETCERLGKQPEHGFSGKVMFRIRPDLHARITRAAELAGRSLNQWGQETLERAVE